MAIQVYTERTGTAAIYNHYIAKDLSGTLLKNTDYLINDPDEASSAIVFTKQNRIVHTGESSTGVGHIGAELNYAIMDSAGKTMALVIPSESKLDVTAGTITTAVLNEAQIGTNLGAIGTLIGFRPYINASTGTITTFYGFYFPDLSGISGITTKNSFLNVDTGAALINYAITYLVGPVNLANFTFATLPNATTHAGYSATCTDNGAGNNPVDVFAKGGIWVLKDNLGTAAS